MPCWSERRLLASDASEADFAACSRLLAAAPGNEQVACVLNGMEKGLEGRRLERIPAPLVDPLSRLWEQSQPTPNPGLLSPTRPHGISSRHRRRDRAGRSASFRLTQRISLIELIGQLGRPEAISYLVRLLKSRPAEQIALAAISALANFPQPVAAAALLKFYPTASAQARDRILAFLCSRPTWAKALLDAIANGQIAAKDLKPAHVQRMAQLSDRELSIGSRPFGAKCRTPDRPRRRSESPRSAGFWSRATRAAPFAANRSSRRISLSATSSLTMARRLAPI